MAKSLLLLILVSQRNRLLEPTLSLDEKVFSGQKWWQNRRRVSELSAKRVFRTAAQ
jgi:hypothetical protein